MSIERRRRRRDRGTEQVPEVVVEVAVEEQEVEELEMEEVEEEPTPAPSRVSRVSRRERRGNREVIKAEETVEQPDSGWEAEALDLTQLEVNRTYIVTRTSNNMWTIAPIDAVPTATGGSRTGKRRTKAEYEAIVYTQDYVDWYNEWNKLSYEQKVKKAKKAGVKWDSHSDSKIDNMRMTAAYRDQLGIEKYKPEYQSTESRKAVR